MEYMYITNRPEIAEIADRSGVDRVWIDLEWMGKDERQYGLDSVKSHHLLSDIDRVKKVLYHSSLQVRVNPLHDASKNEIDEAISRGADIVMLPMYRTVDDAKRFIDIVNGRATTLLLAETIGAEESLDQVASLDGLDEIHIGLNDLHLEKKKSFMFELISDGTVEHMIDVIRSKNIPYGFGGVAKLDGGMIPGRYVLSEHIRLGSSRVILSRSFCQSDNRTDLEVIDEEFKSGMSSLREYERELVSLNSEKLEDNHIELCNRIQDGINSIRG